MSSFYLCCHLNTFSSTPPTEGKKRRLAVSVRMSAPGGRLGPKRLCFCPPCRTAAAVDTHTHSNALTPLLECRLHQRSQSGTAGNVLLCSPLFSSITETSEESSRSDGRTRQDPRDELNHTWRTDLWLWRKFLGGHESES